MEAYSPRRARTCPCFFHGQAYIGQVEPKLGPSRFTFGPRSIRQLRQVDILHHTFCRRVCRRVIGREAKRACGAAVFPVVNLQDEILNPPIRRRLGAFGAVVDRILHQVPAQSAFDADCTLMSQAYSAEQGHERSGWPHLVVEL